jgi:undecaprenyl-diphosphatase
MDRVMVGITELGSAGVMLPLVVAMAAWLAARRCWRTVGYWIVTVASAELMVQVLRRTLGRHRPLSLYQGLEQYSFPSGHATVSAVVLASLAFLLTRGQSLRWRIAVGTTAAVYAALVGFSRLYLGAHWLSDVLGGFSFGLAAVALSAMVYTQHQLDEPIRPKGMALAAVVTIVVAASLWGWWRAPADMKRYAAILPPQQTTLQEWASGGFQQLPRRRHEVAGERGERFTLQVACSEAALRESLQRAGWVTAPGLGLASVLQAIAPHPSVGELPLLPRYDGGRASSIDVMQAPAPGANARNVLRLWQSSWELPGGVTIWYGAFDREVQIRPNYSFLHREPLAAGAFSAALASAGWQRVDAAPQAHDGAPELWTCDGP